jgi:hypothetical protein
LCAASVEIPDGLLNNRHEICSDHCVDSPKKERRGFIRFPHLPVLASAGTMERDAAPKSPTHRRKVTNNLVCGAAGYRTGFPQVTGHAPVRPITQGGG